MIEQDFLDLIILDLKIPTISGALDADSEHGHAVFYRIPPRRSWDTDIHFNGIAC